jgi:hypothetical protein
VDDHASPAEVRAALADPDRCDYEIFPCGLPQGHEDKHRTIVSVRRAAKVNRNDEAGLPYYGT